MEEGLRGALTRCSTPEERMQRRVAVCMPAEEEKDKSFHCLRFSQPSAKVCEVPLVCGIGGQQLGHLSKSEDKISICEEIHVCVCPCFFRITQSVFFRRWGFPHSF